MCGRDSQCIRLIKWIFARLPVKLVTCEGVALGSVEECMSAAVGKKVRAASSVRVMVLVSIPVCDGVYA